MPLNIDLNHDPPETSFFSIDLNMSPSYEEEVAFDMNMYPSYDETFHENEAETISSHNHTNNNNGELSLNELFS